MIWGAGVQGYAHPCELQLKVPTARAVAKRAYFRSNGLSERRLVYPYWSWKPCLICQVQRPPRVHHCPLCRMCVLKRDHHCFFTNSCVGECVCACV